MAILTHKEIAHLKKVIPTPLDIKCVGCDKTPADLEEYVEQAADFEPPITPAAVVMKYEGTYNPTNGHFACTDCYIKMGMPATDPKQSVTSTWVAD
jgi:hypothetical protein